MEKNGNANPEILAVIREAKTTTELYVAFGSIMHGFIDAQPEILNGEAAARLHAYNDAFRIRLLELS